MTLPAQTVEVGQVWHTPFDNYSVRVEAIEGDLVKAWDIERHTALWGSAQNLVDYWNLVEAESDAA